MFPRTRLCASLMLAFSGSLAFSASAQAQATATAETQRVEITGSSIKRIASEGALPVITLNRAAIEQSGASSVRELVQALPSMQGFTSASDSVNGGGGGVTTASLRNLGSIYTLVLLNGRRVAPFNTGSTVNLEQLPLSAIERVEILADGASALYGADAIAGVVNFITKTGSTQGALDLSASKPQHGGGAEQKFSISKGFGDLESQGFNVLLGASAEKSDKILASQREFSKTGVLPFSNGGKDYYFWQLSSNANPPNITLDNDEETLAFYNPVLLRDGNCGTDPGAFLLGSTCRFDYASTVQAQPEAERKNLFISGQLKLGNNFKLFGEALFSDIKMSAAFAPPAQPLAMQKGSTLYNRFVTPFLGTLGVNDADVLYTTYYMRVRDAGLRTDEFRTKGQHLVLGLDGTFGDFEGTASYTHSANTIDTRFAGGYASYNKMNELIDSGAWDPFAQGTAESQAALAPAILSGLSDTTKSTLDVLSVRGSGPVFNAPGGKAYLGFGADATRQGYTSQPSAMAQGANALNPDFDDFPVGASQGALPFDTTRNSSGLFAELQLPLMKGFEVTGSVRYDAYGAAKNSAVFDANGQFLPEVTQGASASKATYKLSARFQPMPELLVRGSVGTGFRAPTLNDITSPLKEAGVIGVQRACPVTDVNDPLYVGCRSEPYQYKAQTGGNSLTGDDALKPETSDQWTLGFRLEPMANLSVGLDFWSVKVKNAITSVPEDAAFDNFETYRSLFVVTTDTATQRPILTFNQVPVNSAVLKAQGLDWDMQLRSKFSFGTLTTQFAGTYLMDSYFDLGFGNGKETSIGKLGSDDQVAFRILARVAASLKTGAFTNTLTWNYKPGYKDQTYSADDGTVRLRNADGTPGAFVDFDGLDVPSYQTFDWQGRYDHSKTLSFTAGIKNLFDKTPPLSLKTVGGNMVGYDPRYADGRGRTFYLEASYKF